MSKLTIDQVNDLLAHGYHTFHAISEDSQDSGLRGLLMAEDAGLLDENIGVYERADRYAEWQMRGVYHDRRRNPALRSVPSILIKEVRS